MTEDQKNSTTQSTGVVRTRRDRAAELRAKNAGAAVAHRPNDGASKVRGHQGAHLSR